MNELQAQRYPIEFVQGIVMGEITPRHFIWHGGPPKYNYTTTTMDVKLTQEEYDEIFPLPQNADITPGYALEARCLKQRKTIEMFEECYKNGSEPVNWLKLLFGIDLHIDTPILEAYEIWKKFHEERIKAKCTKITRAFKRAVLGGMIRKTHFGEEDYLTKRYHLNAPALIKLYGRDISFTEKELDILFPDDDLDWEFLDSNDDTDMRTQVASNKVAYDLVVAADILDVGVNILISKLVQFNHAYSNVVLVKSSSIQDAEKRYNQHKSNIENNFNVIDV